MSSDDASSQNWSKNFQVSFLANSCHSQVPGATESPLDIEVFENSLKFDEKISISNTQGLLKNQGGGLLASNLGSHKSQVFFFSFWITPEIFTTDIRELLKQRFFPAAQIKVAFWLCYEHFFLSNFLY